MKHVTLFTWQNACASATNIVIALRWRAFSLHFAGWCRYSFSFNFCCYNQCTCARTEVLPRLELARLRKVLVFVFIFDASGLNICFAWHFRFADRLSGYKRFTLAPKCLYHPMYNISTDSQTGLCGWMHGIPFWMFRLSVEG